VNGLGGSGHTLALPSANSFMDTDFYVYGYLRAKDNTLYYVGKGKDDRAFVRKGRNIKPPRDKNKIVFLRKNLTEEKAFEWEKFYIKHYGRKDIGTGILRNRTDGGEGMSNPGEETRQKLKKNAERLHSERDDLGRSLQGVKNAERLNTEKDETGKSINARKGGEKAHADKDEFGRSLHALKLHQEKDEFGRSVFAVRGGQEGVKKLNEEKDELGRSKNAKKGGESTHKEKDELGRSVRGVQYSERLHKEKTEQGKSIAAVKGAEKAHSQKNELGKSIAGVRGAAAIHSTKWEDPDHPELGKKPPGVLAQIQRRLGLPSGPENRRRAYP
jgi:hypothetical protein